MTLTDLVIALVVLVVLGVIAFGIFGIGMTGWAASKDKKAKDQAPDLLDQLFDGSDDVVYKTGVIGALPFEDVLLGAKERGYKLEAQETRRGGGSTLVFSRTPDWRPREPEPSSEVTPEPVPTEDGGPQNTQIGLVAAAGVVAILLGVAIGDTWSVVLFGVAAVAFAAAVRLYLARMKI